MVNQTQPVLPITSISEESLCAGAREENGLVPALEDGLEGEADEPMGKDKALRCL